MQSKPLPTWQTKLSDAMRRDPKRTGALGVLSVVLLVLIGRAMIGGRAEPSAAVAGPAVVKKKSVGDAAMRTPNKNLNAAAVQKWLNSSPSKIDRNLFAIKLDFYPLPSGKGLAKGAKSNSDEDKSAAQEADVLKEWAARSEAAQQQARLLRLQSTLMSARPKALINGQMVKEGDAVTANPGDSQGEFRVLKIEPRRVIVERDGIKLEILMK